MRNTSNSIEIYTRYGSPVFKTWSDTILLSCPKSVAIYPTIKDNYHRVHYYEVASRGSMFESFRSVEDYLQEIKSTTHKTMAECIRAFMRYWKEEIQDDRKVYVPTGQWPKQMIDTCRYYDATFSLEFSRLRNIQSEEILLPNAYNCNIYMYELPKQVKKIEMGSECSLHIERELGPNNEYGECPEIITKGGARISIGRINKFLLPLTLDAISVSIYEIQTAKDLTIKTSYQCSLFDVNMQKGDKITIYSPTTIFYNKNMKGDNLIVNGARLDTGLTLQLGTVLRIKEWNDAQTIESTQQGENGPIHFFIDTIRLHGHTLNLVNGRPHGHPLYVYARNIFTGDNSSDILINKGVNSKIIVCDNYEIKGKSINQAFCKGKGLTLCDSNETILKRWFEGREK